MKNSGTDTFKEQTKKALEILEKEVRPQVKVYENLKPKNSSAELILNSAQKAYLACERPL